MTKSVHTLQIEVWPIDRFVFYARNPRKNDDAVDRMCSSIREFGFKIPVLARSDGTVVDGHYTVVKARGSKHEFETREYVIGQGGMKLLPRDLTASAALPFQNYSSMLSRAPTRLSLPARINGAATVGGKD